mgnify:CR=1 FL=1
MKRLQPGDTLIEVLFAFTILSLVISVMFSGAMASYKSAINAQDRTTALFVAQFQADGLKTYRDSLLWEGTQGYTFLDGNQLNTSKGLVAVKGLPTNTNWCMNIPTDTDQYWRIITTIDDCNTVAKNLAPSLISPRIEINRQAFAKKSDGITDDTSKVIITVKVIWTAKNSNKEESVVNTVFLIKQ